ncbi:MAG TPA: hypothetical protein VFZ04_23045 [Longimicrobiales bacterium]
MNLRSASLLLLPVMLAACSDDGSGPNNTGDPLTRAEALMIAAAVSGSIQTTSAAPTVTSAQDGAAAVPITFTQEHESTHPCPSGGSLTLSWTVSGTADAEAGVFELDLDGTHKPSACAYPHQGLTFSITGDPDLDFSAHMAFASHQPSEPFTANIAGAFNWTASDGRSGHCSVQYAEVTDFVAGQRTVDGNVCGHTVKETFTWSGAD